MGGGLSAVGYGWEAMGSRPWAVGKGIDKGNNVCSMLKVAIGDRQEQEGDEAGSRKRTQCATARVGGHELAYSLGSCQELSAGGGGSRVRIALKCVCRSGMWLLIISQILSRTSPGICFAASPEISIFRITASNTNSSRRNALCSIPCVERRIF